MGPPRALRWSRRSARCRRTQLRSAERRAGLPPSPATEADPPRAHYLKAIAALKSAKDGKAGVARMEELPTDDPLFGKGTIDRNGRKRHAMYVYEVKKPEESKGKWDTYKLIRDVPADQAFRAPADSGCALIK